jgi:hypothetical protein
VYIPKLWRRKAASKMRKRKSRMGGNPSQAKKDGL